MFNFDFLEKGLGIGSPPDFVYETIFSYYVPTSQISFSDYLYFSRYWAIYTWQLIVSQNHFHNILRLFDILLVKKMLDYYLQTWYIRVVLHVTKI